MKRIVFYLVLAIAIVSLTAACTQSQFQDVETDHEVARADENLTAQVLNPDSITVYRNVDLHPNVAVLCIKGAAIVTHTREAAPFYVPELNHTCPGGSATGE